MRSRIALHALAPSQCDGGPFATAAPSVGRRINVCVGRSPESVLGAAVLLPERFRAVLRLRRRRARWQSCPARHRSLPRLRNRAWL